MKQWLLALDIDPHTPVATIKGYRVCSEHFREDDYFHKMEFATRTMKRVLKDTAIPSIVQTGQSGSPAATDEPSDLQLDLPEVEDASSLFAGVPHSTPPKNLYCTHCRVQISTNFEAHKSCSDSYRDKANDCLGTQLDTSIGRIIHILSFDEFMRSV
nr:uncharacterized protein LOC129418782 isoform X2 [Misgurnus anguillicaudatus]